MSKPDVSLGQDWVSKVTQADGPEVSTIGAGAEKPLRIWAAHCPFRKTGSPVLGTMGAIIEGVIVMRMDTWEELCRRVPALQTMQFEVGSFN